MTLFDDQVAVVTGAGSGIGAATARTFAAEGARVVLADIDVGNCEKVARSITAMGGSATAVECDVSTRSAVEAMVETTRRAYGRLDYAFNNAGIPGRGERAVHEADEEDWDEVIRTNLKGVWLCMKAQLVVMLEQGHGAIVNGASVASLVAFDRLGAYVASKHGILGLTKSAALEYADRGIRINAVCPGVVRTPFTDTFTGGSAEAEARFIEVEPMGRMADPDEVASAVTWLCSDRSSFVTGHGLVVDGGLVTR